MAKMLDFEEFKRRYQEVPVEEYPNQVREAVPDPLLTVHLITYNHADYIRKAIESVLMQEVDFPMEIVLGDDDSSDGTREICIEYAEKYPDLIRLLLHHRENNHRLHGRPTHLFQYWYNSFIFRGKYFAVLSGDDYWGDRKKLEKQVSFLEKKENFSLSFHDAIVVNEDGETILESKTPEKNKHNFPEEELMEGPYLPALSLLGRNVLGEIPEEALLCLNEDKFTISILGHFGKGAYQDEVDPAFYRRHGDGIWSETDREYKSKCLKETYLHLSDYHKSMGNENVSCEIENKLIEQMKIDYQRKLEKFEYMEAAKFITRIVSKQIEKGAAVKAFYSLWGGIRFFAGSVKRNLIRPKNA